MDQANNINSIMPLLIAQQRICSLKKFRTNPKEVNMAIVKFFHRIAFDLKSPAYLYSVRGFL